MPEYWQGVYYGAHFNSGAGNVNVNAYRDLSDARDQVNSNNTTVNGITNTSGSAQYKAKASGSEANLFLGYNLNLALKQYQAILGGQVEGSIFAALESITSQNIANTVSTDVTRNGTTTHTDATSTTTLSQTLRLTSLFSFIGRGGVLVQPQTLVYGLFGGTEGNFSLNTTDSRLWKLGLVAGAGSEYKINQHWSILGEYRYLFFNRMTNRSTTTSSSVIAGNSFIVTSNTTQTVIKPNWSFNLGNVGIVYRA